MSEYVAGKGTTAMSIIGTSLGGIAVAGQGIFSGMRNNGGGGDGGNYSGMAMVEKLAAKDAEIARLNSERYSDAALAAANQFTRDTILETYKELKGDIYDMKERAAEKWAEQGVINAKVDSGLSVLGSQVAGISATVAAITKTVIPNSAICPGWGEATVTVTTGTTTTA